MLLVVGTIGDGGLGDAGLFMATSDVVAFLMSCRSPCRLISLAIAIKRFL